jgi:ferredoxin
MTERIPVVELSDCILCGVCVDVCPDVFRDSDLGYIEVVEMATYPEEEVEDAIRHCPKDCIYWEEQ